jgi:hypothetical protein
MGFPRWLPSRRSQPTLIPTSPRNAKFNIYTQYARAPCGVIVMLTHAAEPCLRASMGFPYGIMYNDHLPHQQADIGCQEPSSSELGL